MCFFRMAASPMMAGAARHFFLCAEFPDISSTPALRSDSGEHTPGQAPPIYLRIDLLGCASRASREGMAAAAPPEAQWLGLLQKWLGT